MKKRISKAILSGLGFASLTRDAIRATANDLVKQSKLSEAEGKRLVNDFRVRTAHIQKVLEKKVESAVHQALKHLELPKIHRPTKRKSSSSRSRRSVRH